MSVTAVTCQINVCMKCWNVLTGCYLFIFIFWNVSDSVLVWLTFNELFKMNRLISDGVWKCKKPCAIQTSVSLNYARNASLFLIEARARFTERLSLKIICFDSSECVIPLKLSVLFIFSFVITFCFIASLFSHWHETKNEITVFILFIFVLTLASISISCGMNRNRSNTNNNRKKMICKIAHINFHTDYRYVVRVEYCLDTLNNEQDSFFSL